MGLGVILSRAVNYIKTGDDGLICAHESCMKRRLVGRDHCFDHELEAEELLDGEPPANVTEPDVYVYFIGVDGEDAVKIGRTSGDAGSRLKSLQTGHYKQLKLLATISMPFEVERWIHKGLADAHLRGEWFQRTEKVNKIIEAAKSGDWQRFFQAFA